MFCLTEEERKVILFLAGVALLGIGLNFALKANARAEKFIRPGIELSKLNINQATLQDLVGSRAVTKKIALAILEYRQDSSGFKDMEELKEVKGVGSCRLEKLKEVFYLP
jgi:competence ComEA-like helix-hairpin-helix protein